MENTPTEQRRYQSMLDRLKEQNSSVYRLIMANKEGFILMLGDANYLYDTSNAVNHGLGDPLWEEVLRNIRENGPDLKRANEVLAGLNKGFEDVGATIHTTHNEVYGVETVMKFVHDNDAGRKPYLIRNVVDPKIGKASTTVYCPQDKAIPPQINETIYGLYHNIPGGIAGIFGWSRELPYKDIV